MFRDDPPDPSWPFWMQRLPSHGEEKGTGDDEGFDDGDLGLRRDDRNPLAPREPTKKRKHRQNQDGDQEEDPPPEDQRATKRRRIYEEAPEGESIWQGQRVPRPQLTSPQPFRKVKVPNTSFHLDFESHVPRLRELEDPERRERLRQRRRSRSITLETPPVRGLSMEEEEGSPSTSSSFTPPPTLSSDPPLTSSVSSPFTSAPTRPLSFSRHESNIFRVIAEDAYVAFLDRFEEIQADDDDEDRRWTVQMQCVPETWIDKVWGELRDSGLLPDLFRLLPQLAGTKTTYGEALRSLPYDDQALLFLVWYWFTKRLLEKGDEAPLTLLTLTIDEKQLRLLFGLPTLEEAPDLEIDEEPFLDLWYHVRFSPTEWLGLLAEAWVPELDATNDGDPFTVAVSPHSFALVADHQDGDREIPQSVLRHLHFPRTAPVPPQDMVIDGDDNEEGFGGSFVFGQDNQGNEDEGNPFDWTFRWIDGARAWVTDRLAAWKQRLRDWLDRWSGPWGAPALAGAGGPPLLLPWPEEAPDRTAHVHAYTGANDPGPAGNPQPTNAMTVNAGAYQPFVGVLDVGQGNCNVLFDEDGHAVVYYDFGYTTETNKNGPAVDPVPNLDHGPLIVLSHWDLDHCGLARKHPRAFDLNWLAPQQDMGTVEVRDCIARLMKQGGHLYLWEETTGHMTFPWGFVVRGDDVRGGRNNTGLVLYACVRNGAGNIAAGSAPTAPCANIDGTTAAAAVRATLNDLTPRKGQVSDSALAHTLRKVSAYARMRRIGATMHAVPDADPAIAAAFGVTYRTETRNNTQTEARIVLAARVVHEAFQATGGAATADIQIATVAAILALENHDAGTPIANATVIAAAQEAVTQASGGTSGARPGASSFSVALYTTVSTSHPDPSFDQAVANRAAKLAKRAVRWDDNNAAPPPKTKKKGKKKAPPNPYDERAAAMDNSADGYLAGATVQMYVIACEKGGSVGDQVEAAVGHFGTEKKLDGMTSPKHDARAIVEQLGLAPVPPGPIVPGVIQPTTPHTNPPYATDELFVMSTGDVMVQFIPTQRFSPPPLVIGMVAPHHGSIKADNVKLQSSTIPWAPCSIAAFAAGSSAPGASVAERVAVAAAVAVMPVTDVAMTATRESNVRAALAALEARRAGDDTGVALVYAAGRHRDPAATLADARALLAAAEVLAAASAPYTADQVLTQAEFMTPAPADRQALAGAARAYHEHGTITPATWGDPEKSEAVTAAAKAGRALAKGERPVSAGRAKFVRIVQDTELKVNLSTEVCGDVLTGAYDGLGAPTAARITEFAVAVLAGIAMEHAKEAHDGETWNNKDLRDANYPAAARLATALAATAATAAKAAGYAGNTANLARVLVSAGMADDAMADAARRAMSVPRVGRGPAVIAYPAGMKGNKFGHPNVEAIEIYRAHGYEIEMYTTNTPVKNPAVGWVQPALGDGNALPGPTIAGAAGSGITTFDTR